LLGDIFLLKSLFLSFCFFVFIYLYYFIFIFIRKSKVGWGVSTNTAGTERNCTRSITALYTQCKATTFSLQNRNCFSKDLLKRKR